MGRKLALITGASAGLGAAFAKACAARGYDLALVARRVDRLEALAAELRDRHCIEAFAIVADLATPGIEESVIAAVAARGRHVDLLINNAGFSIPKSFAAVPWARQQSFLMTLVVSACGLAHLVIPGMIARGGGRIINVASLAGYAPGAKGHTLYPGVKSLTIKFTEALDAEYRDQGLRVTATCPGFTQTEFAAANGTQAAMDQSPRFFFQTAEAVVAETLRAHDRGQVVVVTGWHNKLASILLRHLPETLVKAVIATGAKRYHLD